MKRKPMKLDGAGRIQLSEADIQDQIIALLEVHGALVLENRSHSVLDQIAGGGKAKGSPDLIAALPGGRTLWIEVKRPGQKQKPKQIEWQAQLKERGHKYVLATSIEDLYELHELHVSVAEQWQGANRRTALIHPDNLDGSGAV